MRQVEYFRLDLNIVETTHIGHVIGVIRLLELDHELRTQCDPYQVRFRFQVDRDRLPGSICCRRIDNKPVNSVSTNRDAIANASTLVGRRWESIIFVIKVLMTERQRCGRRIV